MENNIWFFGDQIFFSYDLLHVYPVKKKKKKMMRRGKRKEKKRKSSVTKFPSVFYKFFYIVVSISRFIVELER